MPWDSFRVDGLVVVGASLFFGGGDDLEGLSMIGERRRMGDTDVVRMCLRPSQKENGSGYTTSHQRSVKKALPQISPALPRT